MFGSFNYFLYLCSMKGEMDKAPVQTPNPLT